MNSPGTYCFVPYTSSCSQSITILQQEGKGSFSECDQQTISKVGQFMNEAIAEGLVDSTTDTITTGDSLV